MGFKGFRFNFSSRMSAPRLPSFIDSRKEVPHQKNQRLSPSHFGKSPGYFMLTRESWLQRIVGAHMTYSLNSQYQPLITPIVVPLHNPLYNPLLRSLGYSSYSTHDDFKSLRPAATRKPQIPDKTFGLGTAPTQ